MRGHTITSHTLTVVQDHTIHLVPIALWKSLPVQTTFGNSVIKWHQLQIDWIVTIHKNLNTIFLLI